MPSQSPGPVFSVPWYAIPALLLISPFVLAYDRLKTWRHRVRSR